MQIIGWRTLPSIYARTLHDLAGAFSWARHEVAKWALTMFFAECGSTCLLWRRLLRTSDQYGQFFCQAQIIGSLIEQNDEAMNAAFTMPFCFRSLVVLFIGLACFGSCGDAAVFIVAWCLLYGTLVCGGGRLYRSILALGIMIVACFCFFFRWVIFFAQCYQSDSFPSLWGSLLWVSVALYLLTFGLLAFSLLLAVQWFVGPTWSYFARRDLAGITCLAIDSNWLSLWWWRVFGFNGWLHLAFF